MNEPKLAYRYKFLLFWLQTCLGISYSSAQHFTFKPGALAKVVGTLRCFCRRRRELELRH